MSIVGGQALVPDDDELDVLAHGLCALERRLDQAMTELCERDRTMAERARLSLRL